MPHQKRSQGVWIPLLKTIENAGFRRNISEWFQLGMGLRTASFGATVVESAKAVHAFGIMKLNREQSPGQRLFSWKAKSHPEMDRRIRGYIAHFTGSRWFPGLLDRFPTTHPRDDRGTYQPPWSAASA